MIKRHEIDYIRQNTSQFNLVKTASRQGGFTVSDSKSVMLTISGNPLGRLNKGHGLEADTFIYHKNQN